MGVSPSCIIRPFLVFLFASRTNTAPMPHAKANTNASHRRPARSTTQQKVPCQQDLNPSPYAPYAGSWPDRQPDQKGRTSFVY
jgi:hypothetical protein